MTFLNNKKGQVMRGHMRVCVALLTCTQCCFQVIPDVISSRIVVFHMFIRLIECK